MPNISSDQIRDISVKAVEQFLNNKIPLSEGIAKQASYLGLNSEQIQRSVEATNSIAYLKVLTLTDDRTTEFPLCKYAEVMAHLVLPEASNPIEKMASVVENSMSESKHDFQLSQAELNIAFVKQAALNDAELERLRDRSITLLPELVKAASEVKKDPQGLYKLSAAYTGPEFKIMSTLVYGEPKEHANIGIFKKAEFKQVLNLETLYKEAQTLQSAIKEKQALADRCGIIKQAGIMSGVGKAIGSTLAAPIAGTFRAAGRAVANGIKTTGANTATAFKNTVGKIKDPKGFVSTKTTTRGILGVTGLAAGAAFDASMYKPSVNKDTGTSSDVWSTLQRK